MVLVLEMLLESVTPLSRIRLIWSIHQRRSDIFAEILASYSLVAVGSFRSDASASGIVDGHGRSGHRSISTSYRLIAERREIIRGRVLQDFAGMWRLWGQPRREHERNVNNGTTPNSGGIVVCVVRI